MVLSRWAIDHWWRRLMYGTINEYPAGMEQIVLIMELISV